MSLSVNWRDLDALHIAENAELNQRVFIRGVENIEQFREVEQAIGTVLLAHYHPEISSSEVENLVGELHHAPNTRFVKDKLPSAGKCGLSGIMGSKIRPSNQPDPRIPIDQLALVRLHAIQEVQTQTIYFNVVDVLIHARQDRADRIRLYREIHPLKRYERLEHTKVLCDT